MSELSDYSQDRHLVASRRRALRALLAFDPVSPGFGVDSHSTEDPVENSMAYALYSSACAMLGMIPEAKVAVNWLERCARKDGQDGFGWGLPYEFDAFAKGDPNPPETIYGITTAIAVRAIFDFEKASVKSLMPNSAAVRALENYARFVSRTDSGLFFWYSDRAADARSVFNVSSMLAGQYARAGVALDRADFRDLALAAARDILASAKVSRQGRYWSYGTDSDRPNDALHAAYTVQGLLEVDRYLGLEDFASDLLLRYLRAFLRKGIAREYVPHENLADNQIRSAARLWSVGMLMFTAYEAEDFELAELANCALDHYSIDGSAYGLLPKKKHFYLRHQAHVALGLSRAASYLQGDIPYATLSRLRAEA